LIPDRPTDRHITRFVHDGSPTKFWADCLWQAHGTRGLPSMIRASRPSSRSPRTPPAAARYLRERWPPRTLAEMEHENGSRRLGRTMGAPTVQWTPWQPGAAEALRDFSGERIHRLQPGGSSKLGRESGLQFDVQTHLKPGFLRRDCRRAKLDEILLGTGAWIWGPHHRSSQDRPGRVTKPGNGDGLYAPTLESIGITCRVGGRAPTPGWPGVTTRDGSTLAVEAGSAPRCAFQQAQGFGKGGVVLVEGQRPMPAMARRQRSGVLVWRSVWGSNPGKAARWTKRPRRAPRHAGTAVSLPGPAPRDTDHRRGSEHRRGRRAILTAGAVGWQVRTGGGGGGRARVAGSFPFGNRQTRVRATRWHDFRRNLGLPATARGPAVACSPARWLDTPVAVPGPGSRARRSSSCAIGGPRARLPTDGGASGGSSALSRGHAGGRV